MHRNQSFLFGMLAEMWVNIAFRCLYFQFFSPCVDRKYFIYSWRQYLLWHDKTIPTQSGTCPHPPPCNFINAMTVVYRSILFDKYIQHLQLICSFCQVCLLFFPHVIIYGAKVFQSSFFFCQTWSKQQASNEPKEKV